ncbi:MAG: hypothetical protein GIW97_00535 [Candidatus Eremiobacteraeota bacterium]|nr:hypothetical protein [Candidatus Eremiobacteraeota bacterium]
MLMWIAQCEANALKEFLNTIRGDALARKLQWNGTIENEQADRRFTRYGSHFEIRGTDGCVTKTACVPLFKDGSCLHNEQSLRDAFLAAVSETAIAVLGPVPVRPMPQRRASDRVIA